MRYTTQLFAALLTLLCLAGTARANYYPIKLVDNAGKTDTGIHSYIIFMAQDTTTAANYCVLQLAYDSIANALKATLVPIGQNTNAMNYTYRIDELPGYNAATKSVTLLMPNTISGRCMVSLNYKLWLPPVLADSELGQWVFQSPSVSNVSDVNYDIVYDKFEFTYNTSNVFYIDPTAVDFFSIPISLQGRKQKSGPVAGAKRSKLMATITGALNGSAGSWDSLAIMNGSTLMRITAPNLAPAFSSNYLTQSSYNYIDSLVKYYQSNVVRINCSELDVAGDEIFDKYNVLPTQDTGAYIFTSSPIVNGLWIFQNKPKQTTGTPIIDTIDMNTAVSNNFFGPGTTPFVTPNKTVVSILVKNITAAFTVGLLPAPDSMMLDANYLSNPKKYPYYKKNKLLNAPAGSGPWYNLYTKALHKAIPQIYAFAFDDVLGQSGTLVSADNTDTISVTLGDVGNIALPAHSSLLPVFAATLTGNTGFVHVGNQYIDTLRWQMPANQPPNAQYFFMGSGPDFTITDSTFLAYQYGNFFQANDTMGWVSIPDALLTGSCTNLLIPMTINTCGGPANPCPTSSSNWKQWMISAVSAAVPGVNGIVYPPTPVYYAQFDTSGSNYIATVKWTIPAGQPANASYFLMPGGPGFVGVQDSTVAWQVDNLYGSTVDSVTFLLPASAVNVSKLDSISIQVFTCGGPGHPCPTKSNLGNWTCDAGSPLLYPTTTTAALQSRKKKKK